MVNEPTVYNTRTVYDKAGGAPTPEPPLPDGYKRVEYIRTILDNSTPEISVGFPINYTDKIEAKFFWNQPIYGQNYLYFFYTWDFSKRSFKIEGPNSRALLKWNSSNATENDTNFTQGEFKFSFSVNEGLIINGVNYPSNIGGNDGNASLGRICHFALNQDCSLYYFRVLNADNTLKRDCVPCVKLDGMVAGLYEQVLGNFITPIGGWSNYGPFVDD